jgi:UDP-galactopyranose mutase
MVAGHPLVAAGHDLRNTPSWMGVGAYLEQSFGAWRVPGGFARLLELLEARLAKRQVVVRTRTEVRDVLIRDGRVVGIELDEGEEFAADAVVVAVDPRRMPALVRKADRTIPALPPVIAHIGIQGEVEDLPHELILHADPMLVVRRGLSAPAGHSALTIHARGRIAEDVVTALSRHKIDLRNRIVTRVDLSPRDLVQQWRGSPYGVLWQGRTTVRDKMGPRTPIDGLYIAGAHTAPGSDVPFVAQSAALVAQLIGPA